MTRTMLADLLVRGLFIGCLLAEAWNEWQWRKKHPKTESKFID